MAYTVMGDAVNLGSRLEGLTKQYGVGLIISETTRAAVADILCRELDKVKVKGKDIPVTIYEPLGIAEELSNKEKQELEQYKLMLALYHKQHWNEAEQLLLELQIIFPEKMIYKIYLERIEHFKHHPPGEQWDGIFIHTSK